MSYLVMDKYLKMIKKNVNEYMKIILNTRYVKGICDEFAAEYVKAIYYDTYTPDKRINKISNIKENIDKLYNKLLTSNEDKKRLRDIKIVYTFLPEIIGIEAWCRRGKIDTVLEKIDKLIDENFKKIKYDYKEKLIEQVKINIKEKDQFISKYESKEFYIEKKKVKDSLYKINLKYNIKFPMIYSYNAIDKVYHTAIISEDRLFIEYILATVQVIKDVESGIYCQEYLLDFEDTLFSKKQKLSRLLDVIKNYELQDRLSILIDNSTFNANKDSVYELIKNGFKIAIKLDNTFEYNDIEIERFNLFSYTLVSKSLACNKEILSNKDILKNIIEIQ